jgi:Flp pilus assembly protein TadD/ribosomal protein S11
MIATITSALQRGDVTTALTAAQSFVQQAPNNPQAHHWLGICLQRSGDVAAARAAIDQAINLAPDRADFQISRASLALGQKDYAAAEKGMKEAVSLDPNSLQAYITLAHMALARSENDEASKQLKLAQRVDPDHPHVLILEGHVAQYGGQSDYALKCFTRAGVMDPQNPLAQLSLGMAYGERQMWPFAEQAFKNAFALEPTNPGVMRGLVRSQMLQEKHIEAIDTLGQWLLRKPDDASVRMMRGQLRLNNNDIEAGLEDLQMVHDANPGNHHAVSPLVNVLVQLNRRDEAMQVLENALEKAPTNDVLWMLRSTMTSHDLEETKKVQERWLAALPNSAQAHESIAQRHEALAEFEQAEINADIAIAIQPNVPYAQFIKLRAEIRHNPKSALERLDVLQGAAQNNDSLRMVLAWRGIALDKLGKFEQAAASFREMAKIELNQHWLPQILPGFENKESAIEGNLLWAPTGVRIERVLQALQPALKQNLLAERNLPIARGDGFGHARAMPGAPEAGTAQRWKTIIESLNLDPSKVVDWIPHFDGYTASALQGLRTVAVITDPRDAFINWMVFGSAQAYRFSGDTQMSAEWLAQSCEAFAQHVEEHGDMASMVKIDGLPKQADAIANALQLAFGLTDMPDTAALQSTLHALGGINNEFPSGHWREYRNSFKSEFDRLTPVAVRLGYTES